MGITITKQFGPYPFAHRQPNHLGHCHLIHGHNWIFSITFTSKTLDKNGFVIDFGGMRGLKELFETYFDHTLVLNQDDPRLKDITRCLEGTGRGNGLARICLVPNCGAEGIAQKVEVITRGWLTDCEEYLRRHVRVTSVTVFEDEKNSATYTP